MIAIAPIQQSLEKLLFFVALGQDFGDRLRYLPEGFVTAAGQGKVLLQFFQLVLIPEPEGIMQSVYHRLKALLVCKVGSFGPLQRGGQAHGVFLLFQQPVFAPQPDDIIRPVLMSHTLPFVRDGEVQMLVASISYHQWDLLELIRHAMFPPGHIEHHVADVAFGCADTGANHTDKNVLAI